jgi:hypothetical protein
MFGLTTRWSLAGTGSVFEVIAVAEGGEGMAGITDLGTAFRASA